MQTLKFEEYTPYSRTLSLTDRVLFHSTTAVFSLLCMILFSFTGTDAQTDSLTQTTDTSTAVTDSVSDTTTTQAPSFTLLNGSLPTVVGKDHSPYFVEADVFVSPGSTVSIESGVVILFKNFTGLHVQGSLFAKGTPEEPVVFTSINDQTYNSSTPVSAAPYDWNGIDIYESAIGTRFDNCVISYSVYGIRSQTDQLKITDSRFLQNGKSSLSVKDSTFTLDTTEFSFSAPSPEPVSQRTGMTAPEKNQQTSIRNALQPLPDQSKNKEWLRSVFRYSGMVLAAVGIASAAQEYGDYSNARDEFDMINEKTDYNMQTYTSSDWNRALKDVRKETAITGAFAGSGIIGLVLFSLSFTF